MKRRKLSKKKSRKIFTKGAVNVKKRNLRARPMRGGFRIQLWLAIIRLTAGVYLTPARSRAIVLCLVPLRVPRLAVRSLALSLAVNVLVVVWHIQDNGQSDVCMRLPYMTVIVF